MTESGQQQALWAGLQNGGYVLILPHASALAAAQDLPELAPEDCARRDHLSDRGRQELERLNGEMRSHNITVGRVLTSHDCRCIETAGIMFGQAQPWSIIDDARTANPDLAREGRVALIEAISRWTSADNLALVTHQETIREALGIAPEPAELLVIEPLGESGFRVLGRLRPNRTDR